MKVCLIYDFLTEAGGLERLIANHAKMLAEEGFDVEILTYHYNKEVIDRTGLSKFKITNISAIKTKYELINILSSILLSFLGVYKLKNHNPNLFISYSFPANFLIRDKKIKKVNFMNHYPNFLYLNNKEKLEWASSTKGLRLLVVFLSWFLGNYFKKLDLSLVKKSNLSFANSKFTKKKLDKIYNINSIVSYPPVSPIFKPSNIKIKEKYIFAAGRIIPDKKYDWLIESLSLMKNKLPLYISGDGTNEYKNKLKELAKKKKVKLKFVDKSLEKLIIYYTNAAIFAFSTPGEDFGLVPAESLSCGTPVVVWGDGAGPTEQVIDKVNGFLAKPYNKKDFASKLDLAIADKLKNTNKKKIISSARKFSYRQVKESFIKEIRRIALKDI